MQCARELGGRSAAIGDPRGAEIAQRILENGTGIFDPLSAFLAPDVVTSASWGTVGPRVELFTPRKHLHEAGVSGSL